MPSIIFIQENAFENTVCEMEAILSRGRGVNVPWLYVVWLGPFLALVAWET